MRRIKENYQIYGLDYNSDGSSFVYCGNDNFVLSFFFRKLFPFLKIKVCNSENAKIVTNLSSPSIKEKHSHHIFGVRCDRANPNLLFSGGWDEIVYLWDLRKPTTYANYLTGPLISTDSIDVLDEKLVTGSWRINNPLEVWDLRKFKKLQELDWNSCDNSLVQLCRFQKNNSKILLTAGTNQAGIQLFKEQGLWQKIDEFCDSNEHFTGDFVMTGNGEIFIGNGVGEVVIMNLTK